ncbi:antirestriction protein ArdA [Cupriavidus nantongensis]|uniref:Uncharacterized protein n=1 Tax=Cupriavidus nantongensis TaxID=1796606 RepID=A0A142JN07_9BURK|nr:antirestriction protein ArdA [Cupriavidus nantongensis]AMR79469.1 hypothetical protein A2G96_17925 [Cupriavidus nantongensis]
MTRTIEHADIIDIREITDRVDELRDELQTAMDENEEGHDFETLEEYRAAVRKDVSAAHCHKLYEEERELTELEDILDELRGCGGDHQWEGDWYPLMLIADDHFQDFAQQEAEDCGLIDSSAKWPHTCIDWERAARELRMDYSAVSVTIDGDIREYWYR